MNEELILESLIELYRERGIDLHILLDEPMFDSLKLSTKIKLIKQYASHIASNTSRSLNRSDIKSLLLNSGGMAALTAGSAALGNYTFNMSNGNSALDFSKKHILAAAGLGAAIGIGKTLLDARKHISDRKEIGSLAHRVLLSDKDSDALKLLAVRHLQTGKVNTGLPKNIINQSLMKLTEASPGIGFAVGDIMGTQGGFRNSYSLDKKLKDYVENYQPLKVSPDDYNAHWEGNFAAHEANLKGKTNSIIEKLKGMI